MAYSHSRFKLAVPAAAATTSRAPVQAQAKTELVLGRKWSVENHTDNRSLIIDQTDPKQSVYIFNCTNCTVQVSACIVTFSHCSPKSRSVFA